MLITNNQDLIYPELSYQIVGVLFSVSNQLGFGHRENTVEQAVRQGLIDTNIPFTEQQKSVLKISGKSIKEYKIDFVIDNKIVLELKSKDRFDRQDIAQVYDYLNSHKLRLGILANFGRRGVKFKRIINKIN